MKPPASAEPDRRAPRRAKLLVNLSIRPEAINPGQDSLRLHPAKLSRGLTGVKGYHLSFSNARNSALDGTEALSREHGVSSHVRDVAGARMSVEVRQNRVSARKG